VARVGTNLTLVALVVLWRRQTALVPNLGQAAVLPSRRDRDQFKASYEATVDNRTQVQRLKAWTVLADVIAATSMLAFA
jgi:hypothetical protein